MKFFQHILLVDDDLASNLLNRRMLENTNLAEHITLFGNGEEAIQFIHKETQPDGLLADESRPALIFLDINMPVMNGIEFLHELEKAPPRNIAVVMLSSIDDMSSIAEVAKYKVTYFLTKPLTKEKLKKMITRCFE